MKTEVFENNYVTVSDTSNVLTPIKDGTIFSNHYVFVYTGKNDLSRMFDLFLKYSDSACG